MKHVYAGVSPELMTDGDLKKEFKYIGRLPLYFLVRSKVYGRVPEKYVAGRGNKRFMLAHMGYCFDRYYDLLKEIGRRGMDAKPHPDRFQLVPADCFRVFRPTKDNIKASKEQLEHDMHFNYALYYRGERINLYKALRKVREEW